MSNLKIKPQKRHSLALKVTPNGLELLLPHHLDPDSDRVQTFIDIGMQKLIPPPAVEATLTKAELMALVDQWAEKLGVTLSRIQVRPMRQKWGSISTAGTLTLAADLLDLPRCLVEYVICHELVHLKAPYHNRLYYLLLAQSMPDWQSRAQELGRWVVNLKQGH
jgi:hypothetical protein